MIKKIFLRLLPFASLRLCARSFLFFDNGPSTGVMESSEK